jgi:hypothetical protein
MAAPAAAALPGLNETQLVVFRNRHALLKLRASIVSVVGILGLTVGIVSLLIYSAPIADWVRAISFDQIAGIHIPLHLYQANPYESSGSIMLFGFVFFGCLGLTYALKKGLQRLERIIWTVALLGLSCGILYNNADLALLVAERAAMTKLAGAIRASDSHQIQSLLPANKPLESQYILAQLAMRHSDREGMQTYGQPLLNKVDRLLLRIDAASAEDRRLDAIEDFRIGVLQQLDVALYGTSHGQVSLAPGARNLASLPVATFPWLATTQLAGAFILCFASAWLVWLALQMAQRVHRLLTWIG